MLKRFIHALLNYFQGEDIGWARLVSDILSPPMVWGFLAIPIAFRDAPTREQGLLWAVVYIAIVCVLPIIYVGWMVKSGRITDIHMRVREQRIRPFIVSLTCTAIAWWTLRFMGAPAVLPVLAMFTFIQIAIIAVITLVWQISMHAMSIAGASTATWLIFGSTPALLIMPLVVLVGYARLRLQRHTPMQVFAGTLIGAITPILILGTSGI